MIDAAAGAFANIMGAAICLFASGRLARLAEIRYGILVPVVLALVFIGTFQGSRSWGDLYVLLIFGSAGWLMKYFSWARPPLLLGLVLGDLFERYLVISTQRHGGDWLSRPAVIAIFALMLWSLYRPLRRSLAGKPPWLSPPGPSARKLDPSTVFTAGIVAIVAIALFLSRDWPFYAGIVPRTVGGLALVFATAVLVSDWLRGTETGRRG